LLAPQLLVNLLKARLLLEPRWISLCYYTRLRRLYSVHSTTWLRTCISRISSAELRRLPLHLHHRLLLHELELHLFLDLQLLVHVDVLLEVKAGRVILPERHAEFCEYGLVGLGGE
jgi:hypothetical protein